ncbi:unnamed protein product [Caenorhabditis angaria]|uniref:F-box domain-containing protein n=1 Tax=Caenorhabditis angaria TaxID=860376 RepID=A0A9P1IEF7_9PELO|nr:unnamed protein product [Caenorhabditis angaria]
MGSCFSRKEAQRTQQLDSSISLKETQLDSSLSIELEYNGGIGWFDLPYEMRDMIIGFMDLEGKARLAKCSINCYEEVALSRNYIEEILYSGSFERTRITIEVNRKNEKWYFEIQKSDSGNCELHWNSYPYDLISKTIFRNQDIAEIALKLFNNILKKNSKSLKSITVLSGDFPFNRTNINNLRNGNLEDLVLFENKHGIDPISSGFVDLDLISLFQKRVVLPNIQLCDLFKIKSENRVLCEPKYSLTEFDDFLRRFFIEEEHDESLKCIEFHSLGIDISSNDLTRLIEKYTGTDFSSTVNHYALIECFASIESTLASEKLESADLRLLSSKNRSNDFVKLTFQ